MIVGNMTCLFPLNKLTSTWHDYYINAQGEVFSTRRPPVTQPRRLRGSVLQSGTYVTLQNGSYYSAKERVDSLLSRAMRHVDWKNETSPPQIDALTEGDRVLVKNQAAEWQDGVYAVNSERSHAPSIKKGIEGRGYIIGQVSGEALVFGSKPKVHLTLKSVKGEVERLAAKSPGKTLVYLKIEGSARAASIIWE